MGKAFGKAFGKKNISKKKNPKIPFSNAHAIFINFS